MLGAARMREPRAAVRISGARLHMRLAAFCGPSARDISLRITYLHAATSQVRLRTVAIAFSRGKTPQQCGCVREECERAAQENDSHEIESAGGTPQVEGFTEGLEHDYILGKLQKKPIGPGFRKFYYQGPGTR